MASVIIPDTSEYYVGETGCKFLLCIVKRTYFNGGMTNKVVTKNRCNKSKAGYIFTRLSFNCLKKFSMTIRGVHSKDVEDLNLTR